MDFFRRFTFLLCAPAFDVDELEGGARHQDGCTDAAIGCMIVDWGKKNSISPDLPSRFDAANVPASLESSRPPIGGSASTHVST
jgi:hypothetical protein